MEQRNDRCISGLPPTAGLQSWSLNLDRIFSRLHKCGCYRHLYAAHPRVLELCYLEGSLWMTFPPPGLHPDRSNPSPAPEAFPRPRISTQHCTHLHTEPLVCFLWMGTSHPPCLIYGIFYHLPVLHLNPNWLPHPQMERNADEHSRDAFSRSIAQFPSCLTSSMPH